MLNLISNNFHKINTFQRCNISCFSKKLSFDTCTFTGSNKKYPPFISESEMDFLKNTPDYNSSDFVKFLNDKAKFHKNHAISVEDKYIMDFGHMPKDKEDLILDTINYDIAQHEILRHPPKSVILMEGLKNDILLGKKPDSILKLNDEFNKLNAVAGTLDIKNYLKFQKKLIDFYLG